LGNRGVAKVLRQTLPEPAIPELRRKCACGTESEQECAECSKNRIARDLARDTDAPYQTSPSAETPDVTGEADDSGPVSMAPIQVAGEPHTVEMEGKCAGLRLHGKTSGTFDGGTGQVVNQQVTKGKGCNCDKGVQCVHVTGTLVIDYSVNVTITMPPVPSGLTACELAKVQAFLQNVLLPHEQDHKARLETYNGQTRHRVDVTGCGQDDVTSKVQAIHDAEEPARQAAAQARSDAIDPFVRTIDCSDCDKQSAAPDAGQVGGDTEIAATRLASSSLPA